MKLTQRARRSILLAPLALTAGMLASSAGAFEACDNCDIDGIRKEMKQLADQAVKLTEQAAGKYGDAAADYEAALGDAKDLAGSLIPSVDVFSLCGALDEIKGKAEQAMSALSGLCNLVAAAGNEAEAAELRKQSDWYWKNYLREQKCLERCCKARATPPPLVQQNPDVDFARPLGDAELKECLGRLSDGDRKTLLADAGAGRLKGTLHADNVAAIKRLVAVSGALK